MRCAIYARVSTDEQGTSIVNQQEYFKDYIKKHNLEIFDVYADEAFSGTESKKRLSFQRLLQDGKNKKYQVLLAKSYSRFGRNQRETLTALAELFESGVRIIFVEDGLDSQRDKGQFGLFAWLAEQESRKLSERIKMTWQLYNKEGKIHCTNAPLGYDYNKEIKNFMVNEKEAEVVKIIFGMYLKGEGLRKISNYLNENGIATKHGHKWSHAIVSQTVTNEFYIGTLTQGKRKTIDVTIKKLQLMDRKEWFVHKNNHEAIISTEDFYNVQERYNKRSDMVHADRKTRHSNSHLFSNIIKCEICGASFAFIRKKIEKYTPRYSCISYEQHGLKVCGHKRNSITEQAIINIVKSEMQTLSDNDFQAIKDYYRQKNKGSPACTVKTETQRLERQISEKTAMSLKLLDAFTKGIVGETQFKLQNAAIEKELQSLIRKKEIFAEREKKSRSETDEETETICKIETLLSMNGELWTNEMLKQIIDRIEVNMLQNQVAIFYKHLIPVT
ncbi:MAG: recombinase family protein [Defluviitaleaceae bacterium]|nr:recombinase family protein [Defluviitaleaceae bacterium]